MKKFKSFLFCGIIITLFLVLAGFMLNKSSERLTYLEYYKFAEDCEISLSMQDNTNTIEQEFKMPYEIFKGLSFRTGIYGRENNSTYEMIIMDKTTNTEVFKTDFNTSNATDSNPYQVFSDSPIRVNKDHIFSVSIKPKSRVNCENGIAFYIDGFENLEENEKVKYNNVPQEAKLCMNIYGDEPNQFWFIFTLICEAYIFALIVYMLYLKVKQKPILKNGVIQAGLLGILVFLMLSAFANVKDFCDEVDNMNGGMLINMGKVLYVDYYTGHTPFAYLLCAVFASLNAGSTEQFRLIYYVLVGLIYAGLYIRHKDNFGRLKICLLPILQIAFGVLLADASTMVLSDNIQAVCMIALILEFIQYVKDEKLDWKRSIIVSLCIFCGFTSAFVTVYAIFAVAVGVLVKEIIYWKNNKLSFVELIKRYWKIVICVATPFIALLGYLVLTHSLTEFYEQAYKFNTDIYSLYLHDGLGSNIFQPFLIGITNFMQAVPRAIEKIIEGDQVILYLTQIILVASVVIVIIKLLKNKKYLELIVLAAFICLCYTRINEPFHEIAAWSAIITIVIVFFDFEKNTDTMLISTIIVLTVGTYLYISQDYLFKEKEIITDLEYEIINQTSENEEIFFDMYSFSSVYPIYKGRLPMNRLTFILPWYMDIYELDVIDDLIAKKPRVVIYNEYLKAWNIHGYAPYLDKYLHNNYESTKEQPIIWIEK